MVRNVRVICRSTPSFITLLVYTFHKHIQLGAPLCRPVMLECTLNEYENENVVGSVGVQGTKPIKPMMC
jgi:hypothetical protein